MFDIGWSELLVIAVVMIVVVGPKDLPKMLRAFGKASAKLRTTAAEFRTHFDEALREAELDDVKKTIDDVKKYDPRKTVAEYFEPVRSAGDDLRSSLSNASVKPDEAKPEASATENTIAGPMDSPLKLDDLKDEATPAASVTAPAPEVKAPVKRASRAKPAPADTPEDTQTQAATSEVTPKKRTRKPVTETVVAANTEAVPVLKKAPAKTPVKTSAKTKVALVETDVESATKVASKGRKPASAVKAATKTTKKTGTGQ